MSSFLQQINDPSFDLEPQVSALLKDLGGARLIVACSGGADSVFLLYLLKEYQKELNLDILVAHFNHRWRAEVSDADAEFVVRLSNDLGFQSFIGTTKMQTVKRNETFARTERIAFLRDLAEKEKATLIAFGHQCDDILETQIQRLCRGSSLEGLIAPKPIHFFDQYPSHIRPILHFSARFIREVLQYSSINWREDSTNEDQSIVRNKLRKTVIPDLSELMNRKVSESASRSRRLLEEDASYLNKIAKSQLKACFELEPKLDRLLLRSQDRSITRRGFLYWLNALVDGDAISSKLQDQLMDAIYGDRFREKFSVGKAFLVMNKRFIWIDNNES